MAGLRLGGLASGMDTEAIIKQLMAVEGAGQNRLLGRQWQVEARKTALDQIATKLRALKTAADDMRSAGAWATIQKATSADPTKVAARTTAGAAVGVYSVQVDVLARADQRFYNAAPATAGPTTITINGIDTAIAAGADAAQTAAAINANGRSPAYASVVENRLVLSGKQTGIPLTVVASEWSEEAGLRREQRSAEYRIDGQPQTPSASNVVTGLPGVELTLQALGTVSVNVGAPGPDQEAMKGKVKAFVEAYNSTIDLVREKLDEEKVKNPNTRSDFGKGVLRGDTGLNSLLSQLRGAMGATYKGDTTNPATENPAALNELADIGISVPAAQTSGQISADRLRGKLTLDDAKLTAALTADPFAVQRLLGGVSAVSGFAQEVGRLVDPVARVNSGSLATRAESATRDIERIREQSERMDARMKITEARLRAQFSAMEKALSNTQSTSSWLQGQLGGLQSSSG